MMTADVAAPRAGRREWIGLGVIALPCLLYSMDLTVLNLAIPKLSADLKPTSAQLLWIVDIYGFVLAGMLIPMGTLGDRIGRRRLLMMGAAAFGLASVLASVSRTAGMLIAARAILGVAGATLAPSTLSLIRNMFLDARQRTTAIGVWIASYSVGGAIGPLIGGVLLEHYWWGSVFLIAIPVMVFLLIVGPVLLPEFRDPSAGAVDGPSAVLSLGTVLLAIYGIKQFSQGNVSLIPITCFGSSVAVGTAFIRRQRTLPNPLIDLELFRSPSFSVALGVYTMVTFSAFGIYIFVGQYLQLVAGLTPLTAGVCTLPVFVAFIAGSMVAPALVKRASAEWVMCVAMLTSAAGFGMLAYAATHGSLAAVIVGCVLYSAGLAPVFPLATDMIVGAASAERAGVASAVSETGSELGGALGIAILGSIGTAVYRNGMAHAIPAGVSLAESEAARATLGGAVGVARNVPASVGTALVDAARHAFNLSFAAAAAASALAMIATAVVVATRSFRMPASRAESIS